MSKRNKIGNKSVRKSERANAKTSGVTPVSRIPLSVSARVLSNPKQKLSGSSRRRFQRSRGLAVEDSKGTGVRAHPEVKVALKLQALPMVKLIRRLKQAARRAATAKHILASIDPKSKFVDGLKAEQTHQLSLCRQIGAEISIRNHSTQH